MSLSMSPIRLATLGSSVLTVAALLAVPAHAETLVGLTTTNALLTLDSSTPAQASALTVITGLQSANERILDIDLRPTTGLLYGVSSDSKVYSLSMTGVATFVSALSNALTSDVIGIDFNPVADLAGMASLRVVSSTGQNFAYNISTGATTVASAVQTGFASVAYSNNDLNPATATSLYYLDVASDTLKVATSAFNTPTITTVGPLGFDASGISGFDISGTGAAFAALSDGNTGKSGLYTIDLTTGTASLVGAFGIGGNTAISPPLLGLTAVAVAPVPEPETYALMLAGLLVTARVARRRSTRAS